jgi:SagB-type dehydrogenase family enzyme
MERVERLSAVLAAGHVERVITAPAKAPLPVVTLSDLGLCNFQRYEKLDDTERTRENVFVRVERLADGAPFLAPASRVFLGYDEGLRDHSCSTGLAAHFDRAEARDRAVMEVLERHFHHVTTFNRLDDVRTIVLDRLENDLLGQTLGGLESLGFDCRVYYVPCFEGLHSVLVTLDHESDHGASPNRHARFHCTIQWDVECAIERALTEMVTARCYARWSPGRLRRRGATAPPAVPHPTPRGHVHVSSLKRHPKDPAAVFGAIAEAFQTQIFLCDLTHETVGLPVVRALIPGLQPNFDLLGRAPTDFRARITPHLDSFDSWAASVARGEFAQQSVVWRVPVRAGGAGADRRPGGPGDRNREEEKLPSCILEFQGETVRLPEAESAIGGLLARRRSRRAVGNALGLRQLASVLKHAVGFEGLAFESTYGFYSRRNYPSPGSRHSLEVFIEARDIDGLKAGFYHYSPYAAALTLLSGAYDASPLDNPTLDRDPACLVYLFSERDRLEVKYPDNVRRFAYLEAGHLGQNILLLCEENALNATPLGARLGGRLRSYVSLPPSLTFVYGIAVGGR